MSGGVRVRGLTKRFGSAVALDAVSLDAVPGAFTALLGPSGAGKTTLLRCLVRLADPDAGEMMVAGHAMHAVRGRALGAARRDVGFVFQQFNLVRRRSALENAVAGRLAEAPLWRVAFGRMAEADLRAARVALDRVGLSGLENNRADQLSGGQQQRVAIARALVRKSRVLLADEPVASLDPAAAEGVLALLKDLTRDTGLTVLCSLHQHDLARRFADHVVTLDRPGALRVRAA